MKGTARDRALRSSSSSFGSSVPHDLDRGCSSLFGACGYIVFRIVYSVEVHFRTRLRTVVVLQAVVGSRGLSLIEARQFSAEVQVAVVIDGSTG